MPNLEIIAKEADIIVNGYAFLVKEDKISAFDLNNGIGAAVFTKEGTLVETNMDDIELSITQEYLLTHLSLLEA